MKNYRILFALLVFVLLEGCGGAPIYTAAPIEAWVVDAETGQPIEGANVVMNWQLVVGGLDGPSNRGQLEVMETVTDKSGRFYFDGFTKLNPMMYELRNHDPRIVIFKSGYAYQILVNQYPKAGTETPGIHRTSQHNGRSVKLKKMETIFFPVDGSSGFYTFLNIEIENIVFDGCEWKKMPRFIVAMDREEKRIKALGSKSIIGLVTIDDISSRRGNFWCGSVADFFKEYMK